MDFLFITRHEKNSKKLLINDVGKLFTIQFSLLEHSSLVYHFSVFFIAIVQFIRKLDFSKHVLFVEQQFSIDIYLQKFLNSVCRSRCGPNPKFVALTCWKLRC